MQSFDVSEFDICIAKEISKLNEQYLRGKPLDIIKLISEKKDFLKKLDSANEESKDHD